MRATGVGSMPGEAYDEVARQVTEVFGAEDIVFVPELPERGPQAAIIGRTAGLLDMPIDLQAAGWRVAGGGGRDQRRAASLLAQDLDILEEILDGHTVTLKQQILGPLTLAATLEKQRGDKMLADHGARREISEALADAVSRHVADLQRRFDGDLIIQIDEPSAPAVLGGGIPTASGFSRHRRVTETEAEGLWQPIITAVHDAGHQTVVHSCAPNAPVSLFARAGFDGIAVDLGLATADDDWAAAIEAGVAPWFGSTDPGAIEQFLGRLGFSLETVAEALVISPACGLAGHPPATARQILGAAVAARVSLST